jgi:hypothetical protein
MTGGKRAITGAGPRSDFQSLESGIGGKRGDLLEVQLGQTRGK